MARKLLFPNKTAFQICTQIKTAAWMIQEKVPVRRSQMRFGRFLLVVLLVSAFSGLAGAVPVMDIPNLDSITFWERTGGTAPVDYTFGVNSSELTSQLSDPLGPSNQDITGVVGREFYDVFYSDGNGAFNVIGEYLTIEGVFDAGLPAGGGLNLAEIGLNFSSTPSAIRRECHRWGSPDPHDNGKYTRTGTEAASNSWFSLVLGPSANNP
jgi:hypothetical protein